MFKLPSSKHQTFRNRLHNQMFACWPSLQGYQVMMTPNQQKYWIIILYTRALTFSSTQLTKFLQKAFAKFCPQTMEMCQGQPEHRLKAPWILQLPSFVVLCTIMTSLNSNVCYVMLKFMPTNVNSLHVLKSLVILWPSEQHACHLLPNGTL